MTADSSFDDILNEADEVEEVTTEVTGAADPAPVAEVETVEEVAQPEIPEGYKQDARGVWHRADGTIAHKDEVAKFGQQAAAQTSDKAGATVPAAVPDATPAVPFSFKSQGQEIPLEGATLDKDGNLVVSKSSLATVQGMLARATEFPSVQSREARVNQELTQAKITHRELSTRAEKAEFAYQHLAAILDNEEKLAAFLTDPREREYLLRELTLGMKNAEIARHVADQATQSQAQTAEQSAASELETIAGAVREVMQSPEMKDLAALITPQDVEEATSYFKEMRQALVRTAEDDSLKPYGISKGEKYVTHQPMIQYLTRIATERKKANERIEAATKAGKFNAAQAQGSAKVLPKRAPVTVTADPDKGKKKSWDQSVRDAFSDTDDDE